MSDDAEHQEFARVRGVLSWPQGRDLSGGDLVQNLALLGTFAEKRGAPQLAELLAQVTADPDNPDRLYELGYALIDADAPAVAATVLWRCLQLVGESEEVTSELVSALESALAYADARAVLEQQPRLLERSFLCRYLRGFNAAMMGDMAVVREVAHSLDPATPDNEAMARTLHGFLERADRVAGATPLDDRDLRGWHYVLTGGLLVHRSPYGLDEPMRGRYAWLADSNERIATGLAALAQLVAALPAGTLPCIYAPPGRNHELLARAASKKLGLPLAAWPAVGVPAPGLVVAYDFETLETPHAQQLVHRRPDQVLFTHATPWTETCVVAADVTTLLYQMLRAPWEDPRETRSDDQIVDDIVAASVLGDEERADDPDGWAAIVARAWPFAPGIRARTWAGGPVPSSRFL